MQSQDSIQAVHETVECQLWRLKHKAQIVSNSISNCTSGVWYLAALRVATHPQTLLILFLEPKKTVCLFNYTDYIIISNSIRDIRCRINLSTTRIKHTHQKKKKKSSNINQKLCRFFYVDSALGFLYQAQVAHACTTYASWNQPNSSVDSNLACKNTELLDLWDHCVLQNIDHLFHYSMMRT